MKLQDMKNCEFYQNDKSCLECPYPDGKQPCLKNIAATGEDITIHTSQKMARLIRCIAEYAECSFSDAANALLKQGIKKLKRNVYQEMQKLSTKQQIDKKKKKKQKKEFRSL